MPKADNRAGTIVDRLLICCAILAVTAIGIGIAISAVGVSEQPAEQGDNAQPAEQSDTASIPTILEETPVSAELAATSSANGQFAVDLYQQLVETESDENLFVSPFSISTVLTMVAEGAVGETLDQMIDVLHIPISDLQQFHRRQHELQRAVTPTVPPELAAKIAALRAELKETNKRTETFHREKHFKESFRSSQQGTKLAAEINSLMNRVSAYELQIANAIWVEASYPVELDFLSMVKSDDGASLFPVDFKQRPEPTRLQINEWVAQHTSNRIQNLLLPGRVTDQSRLVMTNTVYFRGDWAHPFQASQTRQESFQRPQDRSIDVPMMHQWNNTTYAAFSRAGDLFPTPREVRIDMKDDDPSLYPDARGHTMLALDYQGHKIQMILIVPRSVTGLRDLEKSLSYETLERWLGQMERRVVQVSIPKFKLESRRELKDALQTLGMQRCFSRQEAQFEKLSASQRTGDRLFISDVVHQTYVDVSEVGTEAAAATSVGGNIGEAGFDEPKTRPFIPIFKADRPFLFVIRDRQTASILFLGRYLGPQF